MFVVRIGLHIYNIYTKSYMPSIRRGSQQILQKVRSASGNYAISASWWARGSRVHSPSGERVNTLAHMQRPTTKRQLRYFLGFVGYYSKFIPHFATVASPLTDFLKKGQPSQLRWDPTQEWAFKLLRNSLSSHPVLHNTDFNLPFVLHTDASGTELGAMLSQMKDDTEHPILFLSRKLQPAEINYSTIEKEALAIKWAMGALQFYLSHNPFTLVVHHAPFIWLARTKDHNPCIMQWYLPLLPFRFIICHHPGRLHLNGDYLSRLFNPDPSIQPPREGVCPAMHLPAEGGGRKKNPWHQSEGC